MLERVSSISQDEDFAPATAEPEPARTPLVSVGIAVYNGQRFLREALESLLAQDYPNLEVVVLDNQSRDATVDICRELAAGDPRLRVVIDDRQRDVVGAQKRVFELARGEFFMIACDDDFYDRRYVSRLMEQLVAHPDVVLAYSRHGLIYPDGRRRAVRGRALAPTPASRTSWRNVATYLRRRTPVPMVFGVVRADAHRHALGYYRRVDEFGWNHDNLYMLGLLTQGPIVGIEDVLFHYRQRDRSDQIPSFPGGWLARYRRLMAHQVAVTRAAMGIVEESPFTAMQRAALTVWAAGVCVHYCTYKLAVNSPTAVRLKNVARRWLHRGSERSGGR